MEIDKKDMNICIREIMAETKSLVTTAEQFPRSAKSIFTYFKEATDPDIIRNLVEALFELLIHRDIEVQIIALKALEWGVKEGRLSEEDIERVKSFAQCESNWILVHMASRRQSQNVNAVAA